MTETTPAPLPGLAAITAANAERDTIRQAEDNLRSRLDTARQECARAVRAANEVGIDMLLANNGLGVVSGKEPVALRKVARDAEDRVAELETALGLLPDKLAACDAAVVEAGTAFMNEYGTLLRAEVEKARADMLEVWRTGVVPILLRLWAIRVTTRRGGLGPQLEDMAFTLGDTGTLSLRGGVLALDGVVHRLGSAWAEDAVANELGKRFQPMEQLAGQLERATRRAEEAAERARQEEAERRRREGPDHQHRRPANYDPRRDPHSDQFVPPELPRGAGPLGGYTHRQPGTTPSAREAAGREENVTR